MPLTRLLLLCALQLFCAVAPAHAETALPTAHDLRAAAQAARARGQPVVLLVSLHDCAYCERVRRDELLPRQRDGLLAWQIDLKSSEAIVGFEGAPVSQAELARRLNVRLAPTVLFLDARGEPVAEPLVGAGLPDFYGAYLDERLAQSRRALSRSN
ncbi:MAG: thioredoxin fold domain-containing protein [Betaproteobacteria bacterium]|nr:thioredoxin fold domain-containing protein [Betaproteobacteria bacterium]